MMIKTKIYVSGRLCRFVTERRRVCSSSAASFNRTKKTRISKSRLSC